MTNGDKIRKMTDDELFKIINGGGCPPDRGFKTSTCRNFERCDTCWLDWLKQKAKS